MFLIFDNGQNQEARAENKRVYAPGWLPRMHQDGASLISKVQGLFTHNIRLRREYAARLQRKLRPPCGNASIAHAN